MRLMHSRHPQLLGLGQVAEDCKIGSFESSYISTLIFYVF